MNREIDSPEGPLAVLLPGLGAVATTFIAGVEAVRRGTALPIGSLTQMQRIRLGAGAERRSPLIRELLPLAALDDLRFAAWDPIPDDAYTAAQEAGVLTWDHLEPLEGFLREIVPMPAVFCPEWVRNLRDQAVNVKRADTVGVLVNLLRMDIRKAMLDAGCERAVMIWCGSTEVHSEPAASTPEELEAYMDAPAGSPLPLPPSMLYAYASILEGVPFANGAPGQGADTPAMVRMSREWGVPVAGRDFSTGQTSLKCAVAPWLKVRSLGLRGWFSGNILGNRDGLVLDDQGSFRSKEVSKLGVLERILEPELYPELYGNAHHQVRIHYYPPAGDDKEAWDAIDVAGWLSMPLELRINFRCRDSILAAPIVLDLALLLDLAARAGLGGEQEALGHFFKSPSVDPDAGNPVEKDVFVTHTRLKNWMRQLAGEPTIDHTEELPE